MKALKLLLPLIGIVLLLQFCSKEEILPNGETKTTFGIDSTKKEEAKNLIFRWSEAFAQEVKGGANRIKDASPSTDNYGFGEKPANILYRSQNGRHLEDMRWKTRNIVLKRGIPFLIDSTVYFASAYNWKGNKAFALKFYILATNNGGRKDTLLRGVRRSELSEKLTDISNSALREAWQSNELYLYLPPIDTMDSNVMWFEKGPYYNKGEVVLLKPKQ